MKTTKKEWLYPLRNPENPRMVELVPVSESFYRAVYPEIWRTRKREMRSGRCVCTKGEIWKCDADCQLCEFHKIGNQLSLDYEFDMGDGSMESMGDTIEDDGSTPFELLYEKELREALHAEIEKLTEPDRAIAKTMLKTNSYEMTARILNLSKSAVRWGWEGRICPQLKKQLKRFF